MKSEIKSLKPDQFLESFMAFGAKRNEVFKKGYELFYIARLKELSKISKPPVPPVKAMTHTFFYLSSGLISLNIGSQKVKIVPGECLIIPAGQVFSHSNEDIEKSEEGEGFMCGFNDDFLTGQVGSRELLSTFEFLKIWGNPIIKPKKESIQLLTLMLERIFGEYGTNGLENKTIIQAYLIALLCDLNIDYTSFSNRGNKSAIALTNRFTELLYLNIRKTHKVSDYAEMLNISPNHLNKTIKLITKKSPSTWIRETLINESKVLLFQSHLSIQEIALELGIEDPSYFSRIFKKQEGITPAKFRK